MTDEEIKKALECCENGNPCSSCPYNGKCTDEDFNDNYLIKDVIALINRQQAEIERLNEKITTKDESNYYFMGQLRTAREELQTAKHEAIKEFAERLKNEMRLEDDCRYDCMNCLYECKGYVPIIDNLVKEMTEVSEK